LEELGTFEAKIQSIRGLFSSSLKISFFVRELVGADALEFSPNTKGYIHGHWFDRSDSGLEISLLVLQRWSMSRKICMASFEEHALTA
jgi:hypothetical protein